jgi:membrane protease YdiL (CAAX protease family)
LLAYLVFVMPLAETLFFRGMMQHNLEFWMTGLLSSGWSILLLFPVMWGDIVQAPAVALFLAIALLTMNMLYSYVRERNGLAAAWLCQIATNFILLFIPYL